jgi:hypothetical protein
MFYECISPPQNKIWLRGPVQTLVCDNKLVRDHRGQLELRKTAVLLIFAKAQIMY